jgi:hypothetical protein
MVIVYTGTIDKNVEVSLDPETHIYDKSKLEVESDFDELYVSPRSWILIVVSRALRIQEEVPGSRALILEGDEPIERFYPPLDSVTPHDQINSLTMKERKLHVSRIYEVGPNHNISRNDGSDFPLDSYHDITDVTEQFFR